MLKDIKEGIGSKKCGQGKKGYRGGVEGIISLENCKWQLNSASKYCT
jgi:hypothetical protein